MSRIFCTALEMNGFCGSGMISACRFLNCFDIKFMTFSLIRFMIFFIAALINLATLPVSLLISFIVFCATSIYSPANSVKELTVVRKLPILCAMSPTASSLQPLLSLCGPVCVLLKVWSIFLSLLTPSPPPSSSPFLSPFVSLPTLFSAFFLF